MLNTVTNNTMIANLINEIASDNSILHKIDGVLLEQIIDYSIKHDDYRALDAITHFHTGIYGYDEQKPEWLKSSFEDKKWTLEFNKTSCEINWDGVLLNDGKRLTDIKHHKLLNSFKYWVTATDNPLENGGKVISRTTAYQKVNRVITLINAILLHSRELNLAEYQLLHVNDDFWLNILTKCAEKGVQASVYEPEKYFKELIKDKCLELDEIKLLNFQEKYPYIMRDISREDILLGIETRVEVCAWLFEQKFYSKSGCIHYEGNSSVLCNLIFEGKILYQSIKLPTYPELHLKAPIRSTEYRAVENKNASPGATEKTISAYIEAIRLIHTNLDRDDSASPPALSERLNTATIRSLVDLKSVGRTRTQEPKFVFSLIKQSYEFVREHLSFAETGTSLLTEVLNILSEAKTKSNVKYSNIYRPSQTSKAWNQALHRNMAYTERGHWLKVEAIDLINRKYRKKGILQIDNFSASDESRYVKIRNNESLFGLFPILQGAIQILLGAIMARRQDELMKLKPYGNLSPNISPFIDEGVKLEYSLIFNAKKTGTKDVNESIERPVPLSIAKFIWELEQFNLKVIELGLNRGNLSLFNNLNNSHYYFSMISSTSYNLHLDALCDYIQTNLVKYDNGEYRRNYVRQHQLRRFFAMAFFWSTGFDGLDALRWMLGHSDIEHLYNYISETEKGVVLNEAKASVIVRGVLDSASELSKLEGIENVRKILAKRLSGDRSTPITIESLSEAVNEYDDDSYLAIPNINTIKRQQAVEFEIIQMLENEEITLEPEFFTVNDSDGNSVKAFNLILKIKDLDRE